MGRPTNTRRFKHIKLDRTLRQNKKMSSEEKRYAATGTTSSKLMKALRELRSNNDPYRFAEKHGLGNCYSENAPGHSGLNRFAFWQKEEGRSAMPHVRLAKENANRLRSAHRIKRLEKKELSRQAKKKRNGKKPQKAMKAPTYRLRSLINKCGRDRRIRQTETRPDAALLNSNPSMWPMKSDNEYRQWLLNRPMVRRAQQECQFPDKNGRKRSKPIEQEDRLEMYDCWSAERQKRLKLHWLQNEETGLRATEKNTRFNNPYFSEKVTETENQG